MEDNTRDCRYCKHNMREKARIGNSWCPKLNAGECKIIGATTHTAFESVSDEERIKIDKEIQDREIKAKAHNIAFNLALTLRIIHDASDIIFLIVALAHWVRTPDLTLMQNIIYSFEHYLFILYPAFAVDIITIILFAIRGSKKR